MVMFPKPRVTRQKQGKLKENWRIGSPMVFIKTQINQIELENPEMAK